MTTHRDDTDIYDENNVLKDQRTARVPLQMRDAAARSGTADLKVFSDGSGGPNSGNRPGWRVPFAADRSSYHDARRKHQVQISNTYKLTDSDEELCDQCDGEGEIDGSECDACGGSGTVPKSSSKNFGSTNETTDHLTGDQRRELLAQTYRDYDQSISDAWRK